MKCFRATFGANPSFAVDKFAFVESVPSAPQKHLPVKLTIDKSFRENLKSSKIANSSAVSLLLPRPSTPSQDYLKFAEELQMSCMSTPGNKFNDSGWASNGNSVSSSFCTDSNFCGPDEDDPLLDVETILDPSPSFENITLPEPLFVHLTSGTENDLSTASFEQDASLSSVSVDANDSTDSLHEWSMADLPSSWQAVTSNLELDGSMLPFDHLDDVDVMATHIDVMVGSGSHEVNSRLDYFPEVNELLAYVGD